MAGDNGAHRQSKCDVLLAEVSISAPSKIGDSTRCAPNTVIAATGQPACLHLVAKELRCFLIRDGPAIETISVKSRIEPS
jgi:hypothetical protein